MYTFMPYVHVHVHFHAMSMCSFLDKEESTDPPGLSAGAVAGIFPGALFLAVVGEQQQMSDLHTSQHTNS